jgi:uncharacterized protein YjbI with pentapeptide repeats
VLTIALFIIIGRFGWDWTGFNGGLSKKTVEIEIARSSQRKETTTVEQSPVKTLWDWLQLLGVLAIPAAVGFGTLWFTTQQNKARDAENENDQREAALQEYIDKMSELLLKENLRGNILTFSVDSKFLKGGELKSGDEVRTVARARTLTALSRLDSRRKSNLLQFLYESRLLEKGKPIVGLHGADLREANLREANLGGAYLSGANLSGANLSRADLSRADLSRADLRGAKLSEAILWNANLREAYLSRADLEGANLIGADLFGADLSRAILVRAFLSEAYLSRAYLEGANLNGANLNGANLSGAILFRAFLEGANLIEAYLIEAIIIGADLFGADLSRANLSGANLFRANLSEAILRDAVSFTTKELEKATPYLKDATMPDGTIHP